MCGIYGYLLCTQDITELTKAGYSSKIRGPERTIIKHTLDSFLVFHRLAIMNTSPLLDQPHIYKSNDEEDTYYYVMCNGEIYNYEALCKQHLDKVTLNDTSSIYPLFEAFDYDFTRLNNELNGEYALVILKFVNNALSDCWMSTDSYSVRPLLFVLIRIMLCFLVYFQV